MKLSVLIHLAVLTALIGCAALDACAQNDRASGRRAPAVERQAQWSDTSQYTAQPPAAAGMSDFGSGTVPSDPFAVSDEDCGCTNRESPADRWRRITAGE